MFQSIRIVLICVEESRLVLIMGIASLYDETLNNLTLKCTKVVYMQSRNRYYLAVSQEWIKNNSLCRIDNHFNCYARGIANHEMLS